MNKTKWWWKFIPRARTSRCKWWQTG